LGIIRNYDAANNQGNAYTGTSYSSSATTWTDLSRHNHGAVTGGYWGTTDHITLDGTDDVVNIGDIFLGDEVTLEATFAIQSLKDNDWQGIMSLRGPSGINMNLAYKADGTIYCQLNEGDNYPSVNWSTPATVYKKYHVIVTLDKTAMKLYVDGELVATHNSTSWGFEVGSKFSNAWGALGAWTSSTKGSYWGYSNSAIYSARVWNRALTQEEIAAMESGLVRDFEAYNNTGIGHTNYSPIWDDLSNHHNGVLKNGPVWNEEYLSLDGVDDWVHLGRVPLTNQVTLETTIELDALESGYVLSNCAQRRGRDYID